MKAIRNFLLEANGNVEKSVKCILKSGAFVLLLRSNTGYSKGHWDLPGGHIKEGESEKDALQREVKEECNLEIENIKASKSVKISIPEEGVVANIKLYNAECDKAQPDVTMHTSNTNKDPHKWHNFPRPEHNEYKWIKWQDELENLPMAEELKKEVMKALEKRKAP